MIWVYIAIFLMVIIFYFDQKVMAKRHTKQLEKIRDEESARWFNELKKENPEFFKKLFGDEDSLH